MAIRSFAAISPCFKAMTACATFLVGAPLPAITPGQNITAVFTMTAGKLVLPDGTQFKGASGRGAAMNNPGMQDQKNVGPIPVGIYRVSMPEMHQYLLKGGRIDTTLSMGLEGIGKTAAALRQLQRDRFFIHHAHGVGSIGCLVFADRDVPKIAAAREKGVFDILKIVAGPPRPTHSRQQNQRLALK